MAVESNGNKKRKTTYQAIGAIGRTRRSIRFILQIVFTILLITILLLCLYGYINQVQTGKSIVESILSLGEDVGNTLMLIFTGQDGAPIDITDNGIYLDGHAPDGSENILDPNYNGGGGDAGGNGSSEASSPSG